MDFAQAQKVYDIAQVKLAKEAAVLPGSTSDYTQVFSQIQDDFGAAMYSASDTSQSFTDKMTTLGVEAAKTIVLQSKLYGQSVPIGSIIKSYTGLLATGTIKSNEI